MNVREVDPSSLSQDQGPFRLAISSHAIVGYSKKDDSISGSIKKKETTAFIIQSRNHCAKRAERWRCDNEHYQLDGFSPVTEYV